MIVLGTIGANILVEYCSKRLEGSLDVSNITTSLKTMKIALKYKRICSLEEENTSPFGLSQMMKTWMGQGTQGLDEGGLEETRILVWK